MRLNMLLNGCDSLSIQFFKSKLGIPSGPDVILLESFLAATFIWSHDIKSIRIASGSTAGSSASWKYSAKASAISVNSHLEFYSYPSSHQ